MTVLILRALESSSKVTDYLSISCKCQEGGGAIFSNVLASSEATISPRNLKYFLHCIHLFFLQTTNVPIANLHLQFANSNIIIEDLQTHQL